MIQLDSLDILLLKISIMIIKLDEKKIMLAGLSITLVTTILGGLILTTFLMPECRDVTC